MQTGRFSKWVAVAAVLCVSYGVPVATAAGSSMKETINATLAYNPTLKAFQEYRQAAEYDLSRARSGWYPRADIRAGVGPERVDDDVTRSTDGPSYDRDTFYTRSEASLTVSQTIWDGLSTWNRVNIGEGRLESAQHRLLDNAEGLALDALLAHIEVYRQRQIVRLAELNVRNHEAILASQKQRQSSGASSLADVTQTETRLARTLASLAESRSALEVGLANYKRLTGQEAGELESPVVPSNAFGSLDSALSFSQSKNRKVQAVRSDVTTADAQAELDKAPFHPQIYLEGSQSYRDNATSSTTWSEETAVMVRGNWNVFNGGYDWYNVKGDKARARQTRQELNGLLDSLAEETTATWSQLISAQEQVKHFSNAVVYSTQTRDMYLDQFNIGQRSLLDVLDAENELFSTSIQLVTAQQNVIAAQYRLLALGSNLLDGFEIVGKELLVTTE